MQKIKNILYLFFFWFTFLWVSLFTLLLKITAFKYILRFFHRIFGVKKKILFLPSYCATNASDRYRAEKWVEVFRKKGYDSQAKYTLNEKQYNEYLNGQDIIYYHIKILLQRFLQITSSLGYNVVIVRREVLLYVDYGNLFFEKFITSLHYNVFLDYDDDIQTSKSKGSKEISFFGKLMLERPQKFYEAFLVYTKFIAGSQYLEELARRLSAPRPIVSSVIPTCVDYNTLLDEGFISPKVYYPKQEGEFYYLGWIGTNYNLFYLDILIPYLNSITKKYPIKLVVIAGQDYSNASAAFEISNRKWSKETELKDMLSFDIGLMPLVNGDMEKGKCGFKLIQYMALGIVGIASAVTVNNEIITDEKDGYLVFDEKDWEKVILKAIENYSSFNEVGQLARKKITEHYSFDANYKKFIEFLESTYN